MLCKKCGNKIERPVTVANAYHEFAVPQAVPSMIAPMMATSAGSVSGRGWTRPARRPAHPRRRILPIHSLSQILSYIILLTVIFDSGRIFYSTSSQRAGPAASAKSLIAASAS